jgi:hypothetical protein
MILRIPVATHGHSTSENQTFLYLQDMAYQIKI